MKEMVFRIKKIKYSNEEIRGLVIASFLIASLFVLTKNYTVVSSYIILKDIFKYFIYGAITVVLSRTVQKFFGLRIGFNINYSIWLPGILISLIMTLLSAGQFMVMLTGTSVASINKKLRLGKYKFGLNYWELGWIMASGPIFSLMLAWFMKLFFLNDFVLINVIYAISCMLPIPNNDGIYLFYGSRWTYLFVIGCMIGIGILIWSPASLLQTFLGGLIFGSAMWLAFYLKYKQ